MACRTCQIDVVTEKRAGTGEAVSRSKEKILSFFFFSSRRRHTRYWRDWSSDVCSSDLGETVLNKRAWAIENLDRVRRFLVYEPRGHADMYGCFVTEPDDGDGDLGVLFFHNAGFSTACGHGTIALATWAIESGIVSPSEPETEMVIDVPSGRLPVTAKVEDGRTISVRFRNVPSFVHSSGLSVGTRSAGEFVLDVAFGGAFYASVDARDLGLPVEPANRARFVEMGREIKNHLNATAEIYHPLEPRLREVYGTIFFEDTER